MDTTSRQSPVIRFKASDKADAGTRACDNYVQWLSRKFYDKEIPKFKWKAVQVPLRARYASEPVRRFRILSTPNPGRIFTTGVCRQAHNTLHPWIRRGRRSNPTHSRSLGVGPGVRTYTDTLEASSAKPPTNNQATRELAMHLEG